MERKNFLESTKRSFAEQMDPEYESHNINESDEDELQILIQAFYGDKQNLDVYKKTTDEYNKEIKKVMTDRNIDEFVTEDGIVAKLSIQNRESFMDDKLISKLKQLGVTTPIKTVEIVDMDELENVIYNGQLNAAELTDCKQVKQVTTLKVSKKKGE